MYRLTTLYRKVDDESTLENFFSSIHLPLAEQLPRLLGSEVCRIDGKPGGVSRFHMSYSLYFDSKEDMYLSLASKAGLKLIETLHSWLEAGVISWFHGEALADGHSSQTVIQ